MPKIAEHPDIQGSLSVSSFILVMLNVNFPELIFNLLFDFFDFFFFFTSCLTSIHNLSVMTDPSPLLPALVPLIRPVL